MITGWALLALVAINLVATLIFGALGLIASMVVALAPLLLVAAVGALGAWFLGQRHRRRVVPRLEDLAAAPMDRVVGTAQVWLEAQRPRLPTPAARQIDIIGAQLDTLAAQLAGVDSESHLGDLRRLVAETLPKVVSAYTEVPAALRGAAHAGATPDEQLSRSLVTISAEVDRASKALAEGALDQLAIQSRYLDLRYGEGQSEPTGV